MRLLVVDDDLEFIEHLEFLLASSYEVESATTPAAAERVLSAGSIDAILLDIDLRTEISGLDMLAKIRGDGNDVPIIMISGATSVETVVAAMKGGADDYIGKTVKLEELKASLSRALSSAKQKRELCYLRSEIEQIKGKLWGDSAGINKIREAIALVADTDSPVLICGESGTGKELVSRSIHQGSRRRDAPFISVNCAAVPKELFESEFFGHEKGAFTGAVQRQVGKLELADGGTLFLDEVGELPFELQAKLLRVLQQKCFSPVGSSREVHSDFRLVSATNQDLAKRIGNGHFRSDLYYRLKVVQIDVPPLRERKQDIPQLVELILAKKCSEMNRRIPEVSGAAMNVFVSYGWPGNVRELENCIECTLIFLRGGRVEPESIKGIGLAGQDKLPDYETGKKEALERYQRDYVELALDINNGNVSKAARAMGLSRQGLYNLMAKLHIGS